jgi:hypothetical protein
VRDAAWLAAEIESWADALADVADVHSAREGDATRTRLAGRGEHALPVALLQRGDAIEVALADWSRAFELDDGEPGEAAELVAAGLFGHARAELDLVGDAWTRLEIQFRIGGRWTTHATLTRRSLAFWRRPTRVHLVNDLAPPPDLTLGECGRLPTAPWIGLLPEARGEPAARELVVDGEIDLHPFAPKDVANVVRAYIDACLEKGVLELRIVHGKGIGNLRRTVHALLADHPAVASFRLGGHGEGSWGATLVTLKKS